MSDHHKRNKNIISNKKAFSSIVGAIFAILVIVSLTGTFFVWSLQQNTRYVKAVSEVDQLVLDQKSESINVTSKPIYTLGADGQTVSVAVQIQNDGPISVRVKTLWVQNLGNLDLYGKAQLDMLLQPGEIQPIPPVSISLGGVVDDDSFSGWVITARGTVVPLYPDHQTGPQGPQGLAGADGEDGLGFNSTGNISLFNGTNGANGINGLDFNSTGNISLFNGTNSYDARTALVAQGIGYVSMNFSLTSHYDFVWGVLSDGTDLTNPSFSYSISSLNQSIIHVALINQDTSRNITLTSGTSIWATCTQAGTVKSDIWTLLNVTSGRAYPSQSTNYSIILRNGTQTDLYFGPAGGQGTSRLNSAGQVVPLNIILFGKLGNDDYGQNLPFIAIRVLS